MIMPCQLTFDVMSVAKSSEEIRDGFGRYMQSERENRGITQKYVADKMNITVTQLSRIENGKSGTARDTVIQWAQAVGVDSNEALRRYKPEINTSGNHRGYDKLSPKMKKLADRQIEAIIESLAAIDNPDFDYIDDDDK